MSKSIWFQPLSIEDFRDSSINMDKHLDIEIVEIGDDFIVGRMPVVEKTKQPYGILHGGASCVLAESIGSTAAALSMDSTKKYPVGIEINANHISSPTDGYVYVRFYYEGIAKNGSQSNDYRTRVTQNWVKESGKWVVKTQHYSPAQFGGVHITVASDFEE